MSMIWSTNSLFTPECNSGLLPIREIFSFHFIQKKAKWHNFFEIIFSSHHNESERSYEDEALFDCHSMEK